MTTNFIPASCPSCAGELQVPDNLSTVKCMYCGVTVVLPQMQRQDSVPTGKNILEIADHSFDAGNYEEAYNYYSKALEYDARNVHALLQRGLAAGWQSTLADFRIHESRVALEKAISIIIETDRVSEYRDDIDASILGIATISLAVLNLAFEHFQNFGVDIIYGSIDTLQLNKSAEAEWHSLNNQALDAILFAIEMADVLEASEEAKLILYKSFLTACHPVLNELALGHPDFVVQKVFTSFPQTMQGAVSTVLIKVFPEAKKLDPSLKDPRSVAQENESKCFVATVAFDDPGNKHVNILREFRHSYLMQCKVGWRFTSWYYRNGERLAKCVENKPNLKKIGNCPATPRNSFLAS